MKRKLIMSVVALVGAVWTAGALALDYPAKTQAVDDLTNSFRPAFTDAALAQSAEDIQVASAFAADFRAEAAPALAEQLGTTPDEFLIAVAMEHRAVGAGLAQLPEILTYFDDLQHVMAAQQSNFHQADAIPLHGVPNTTVHWLFVVLGVLAMAIGAVGLAGHARLARVGAAALGAVVVMVTILISVPAKTEAVDNLNDAFRPIFTVENADRARGYVTTLQAMNQQLTAEALPDVAGMLGVTPEQLGVSLGANFPTVAIGLRSFPAILSRVDGVVTALELNIDSFRLADSIPTNGRPTTDVVRQLVLPSLLLVGLGTAAAWSSRRRRPGGPDHELVVTETAPRVTVGSDA